MKISLSSRTWLTGIVTLFLLVFTHASQALVLAFNDKNGYVEYLGLTGVLNGRNAPFRVLVPDNWDGTLMVYSRGTGSAVLLGEDGLPIFDPSGLPILATNPLANVPNQAFTPGDNTQHDKLEAKLLRGRYALASSDYKPDPRFIDDGLLAWVVEDGYLDTVALTNQARRILRFFHGGLPERTLHWGRSQGSGVGFKLAERDLESRLYDGFIEGCTIGAGTPLNWDNALTFALAFDVAFQLQNGWLAAWGDVGGGDIPETISFIADVLPVLFNPKYPPEEPLEDPPEEPGLLQIPENFPLFEFVRLVSGLPEQEFYPPGVVPDPLPPGLPEGLAEAGSEQFNWLFISMLFLTEVRGDLESAAKAGGRISQNLDHHYSLTDEEITYLATISRDQLPTDKLLNFMNFREKYDVVLDARDYVERFYETTGNLRKNTLTMHGKLDGLALPANETVLKDRATEQGQADRLVQVFTEATGHCNFTQAQWVAAIDGMNYWLDTGNKPGKKIFRKNKGFDNEFSPPAWPQPTTN